MSGKSVLRVTVGQYSDRGRKPVNQDFHGVSIPLEPLLQSKGIAVAIADGIGSSNVSQVASEFAVMGLLDDYYNTSEAWSVKRSVERVLTATNAWLHSRTEQSEHRYDKDRGYVCALSALVLKSTTAHVFHVGDARIYRVHAESLEPLTQDHRVAVAGGHSYLSRAVGFNPRIEIDYLAVAIEAGDQFLLVTDGVHEHVDAAFMAQVIRNNNADLDHAARQICDEAYRRGSPDNLTVQIVVVDEIPDQAAQEVLGQWPALPAPPLLEARMSLDGYQIVRELHASSRSHVYLAVDIETKEPTVLKTPSIALQADPAYLERFVLEEWVARRINNAHVVKPCRQTRKRNFLYVATEFVDGQTLRQWMVDNAAPSVQVVRAIVEQIAKGLLAFHRLEMLHQDLRPDNIMIDQTGTVKIIDFGATRVAGITEIGPPFEPAAILGTAQYTAPEYFLGEAGSERSDLFSLGVITYQLLSGKLPYGSAVSAAQTVSAQRKLRYQSVRDDEREIPAWIDEALRKATDPDPLRRHETLSEFLQDLRHPNRAFLARARPPLIERHPVAFWKGLSLILATVIVALLMTRFGVR